MAAALHPRWKDARPLDDAWRAPAHLTTAERRAEQDGAAGGRHKRVVVLDDGRTATASVALRLFEEGRRIYAYLRWYEAGRTRAHYLGEVDEDTRSANLRVAWQRAHAQRLLKDQRADEDERRGKDGDDA